VSENADLHAKLLGFLMTEWARKENRQLVGVELLFSPGGGYKDEMIRKWLRSDEPDLFAEYGNIEKLCALIMEIAEGEADAKPAGKHRFVVRTHQHMGERMTQAFALSPSYRGSDDIALMPGGGGGGGGGRDASSVLAGHANQLMRINQQMFDGTIRVLGQQTLSLHEQVNTLTAENIMLRRELEDARSSKDAREFQQAMAAEKNARTNMAFKQVLQLGTVVAAKWGASGGGQPQVAGGPSPLLVLIADFAKSLRPEQGNVIMQTLDMAQKIQFMEIINQVRAAMPPDGPPPGQGPGPGQPPSPTGPGPAAPAGP
jgi:hypothetical protein